MSGGRSEQGAAIAANGDLQRRCYVAVAFSDLCDYTALSESADPEEILELRHEVERLARDVIARHSGSINQFAGDGILAVFGLPTPDEHSARHAIEAALALHEAVRSAEWKPIGPLGFRPRFHSGVHVGFIFARRGDPLHGAYELTGDVVNTAARLCSAASADELLVSADALAGLEAFFQTDDARVLSLKGKQHPVSACRVSGRSHVGSWFEARRRRALTPFVGRDDLLGSIETAARRVKAGSGDVLCIVGDPGSGKTRLMDEVAARLRNDGFALRHGSCESQGGVVVPLKPFIQILIDVVAIPAGASEADARARAQSRLVALDPELARFLPTFLQLLSLEPWPAAMAASDSVSEVSTALAQLLETLARHEATVLLLDDWHWADNASTQVLGALTHAVAELPMLILIGAREIDGDDPVLERATRMALSPLSEDESIQVVRALSASSVERSVADRLHLRSGGNPLFLEELCRSLSIGSGAPFPRLSSEVPSTLQALIYSRVERLPARQAQVLRVASVIGDEFSRGLLADLVGITDLDETLNELVAAGLLYPGDEEHSLKFRHGITREVTYESVRLNERRRFHAEVARQLEERQSRSGLVDQYELLAAHYAGAADYARALEFADLAGDKAARASALDVALAQYAAALAHCDRLPSSRELKRRWLAISSKWAGVCIFNPAREQLAMLTRAAECARELADAPAMAYATYWLGWLHYSMGEQEVAIRHLDEALRLAERANDAPLAAQVLVNLGQSHAACCEYAKARDLLERGIQLKRSRANPKRTGRVPGGLVYALSCKALIEGDLGNFASAHELFDEASALVRGSGHAIEGSLFCALGMVELWQGKWSQAMQAARAGLVAAERANGRPYVIAMCRLIDGYAGWVLERAPARLTELQAAVDWLERHEIRLFLSFGLAHLAAALEAAGQPELAAAYAHRALARAAQTDPLGIPLAHRTLARLELAAGRPAEAAAHCRRARDAAAARGSDREIAAAQLALAEALAKSEDGAAARQLSEQAGATFERLQMSAFAEEARRVLSGIAGTGEPRPPDRRPDLDHTPA